MPGGDRSGPMGMGSRTGRGMGFCTGYADPGFTAGGRGRGFGGGRWQGGWQRRGRRSQQCWSWRGTWRGWGPGGAWASAAYAAPDAEGERHYLQGEAEALQRQLDSIQQRLASLEREPDKAD